MAVNPLGEPTDNEVLDVAIVWHTAQQRHDFPARIVQFDLDTQTATVESTIVFVARNQATGEIVEETTIRASGVPIGFYGTGSWALTGPVHIGDQGWCYVSDRCLAEWKSSTETPVTPKKFRRWNVNDCIWLPIHCRPSFPLPTNNGLDPRPAVDAKFNTTVALRVADNQTISLGSLSVEGLIALADLVEARLEALKLVINTHTHVAPVVGVTATGLPQVGVLASVASDRVASE